MPAARGRRPRVILLAEQRLISDAVKVGLDRHSLDVIAIPWPAGTHPGKEMRRQVAALRPSAGLVFGELRDPIRRELACWLFSAVSLRWVLVVNEPDDPAWGELVAAGASAVLPASISLESLAVSMVRLMAGVDLMTGPARERAVAGWVRRARELRPVKIRMDTLSPRESRVLDQLAHGVTVQQIAVRDGVAEGTVRTQVKSVLRKLQVSSQLAAVAAYHQTHDIPPRRLRANPDI